MLIKLLKLYNLLNYFKLEGYYLRKLLNNNFVLTKFNISKQNQQNFGINFYFKILILIVFSLKHR
jgi:hypothetical protein